MSGLVGSRSGIGRRLVEIDPGLRPSDLTGPRGGESAVARERERVVRALADACTLLAIAYGADTLVLGGGVLHHVAGLTGAADALLRHRAADSPFLAALGVADRLVLAPRELPVAQLGAAMLGIPEGLRGQVALPVAWDRSPSWR